jgi:hypothetical protein
MARDGTPEVRMSLDDESLALLVPDISALLASDVVYVRLVWTGRDGSEACLQAATVFAELAQAFAERAAHLAALRDSQN